MRFPAHPLCRVDCPKHELSGCSWSASSSLDCINRFETSRRLSQVLSVEKAYVAAVNNTRTRLPMLKPVHNSKLASPVSTEVFGAPIFNYIPTHRELGPVFDAGMSFVNVYETAAMLDAYKSSPCAIVKAKHAFLQGICRRNSSAASRRYIRRANSRQPSNSLQISPTIQVSVGLRH